MPADYPYATGDLIDQPNSYFYTPYKGIQFIDSWRKTRGKTLSRLPNPVPPKQAVWSPISDSARDLLEKALAGDAVLRDEFVKKFEIYKRVHSHYDKTFKALNKDERYDFSLYLRAADLFEESYRTSGDIRYLNVLLKCLDTLCAYHHVLEDELGARLAWHIRKESEYISRLERQLQVHHDYSG